MRVGAKVQVIRVAHTEGGPTMSPPCGCMGKTGTVIDSWNNGRGVVIRFDGGGRAGMESNCVKEISEEA